MAVIYKPPVQDFGSALGSGVSQGVQSFMEREINRQEQAQIMQHQMQAMNAVKSAPDRESALAVLTTPGAVNNPQELANAMKFVDAIHPPKDTTPKLVTGYDQDTGKKVERYVKESDLPRLNDPSTVHSLFGSNVSLSEPNDIVDAYDSNGKLVGKKPVSQLGPGEMTIKEFEIQEKQKADDRAGKRADRQQTIDAAKANAEARSAAAQERLAQNSGLQAGKTYSAMVADSLNLKKSIGVNGEISIDWDGVDETKRQQYFKMLDAGPELLDKYGKDKNQVLKAVREARGTYGVETPKAPPPAPATPKKEEGFVDKIKKAITPGAKGKLPKDSIEKKDGVYVPKNDTEYGYLSSGDVYLGPDGKKRRKP